MGVLMGLSVINFSARAETVWSGPTTNFTQNANSDVLIPGVVSIHRQSTTYLYNTNAESFANIGTPSDTEWAFGTIANRHSLTFEPFSQIHKDGQDQGQHMNTWLTSGPMVLHIINQDIYVAVTFTSWAPGSLGGNTFTYARSTPAAVAPPPSVTITNPVSGAVFSSPANVTIGANATVSGGTITNVTFLSNGSTLGAKTAPPFTFTANGLADGAYALKAVAFAGGISATSSVVNISVITPVLTSLAAPSATEDNKFLFGYSATPGLRYDVEISSNLFNWTPLATNVASSNLVFFTNDITGDGNYYRVGRLPNP